MNLKHEINRLSHYFNDGMDKVQAATDDFTQTAKSTARHGAKRARREIERGTQQLLSSEEKVMRHLQANTTLYVVGLALLIGLAVANFLRTRRPPEPEIPLL